MNIFDFYLEKILKIITLASKNKIIEIPVNLNGINVDIPPAKFSSDISTNVAMVLAKLNNKSPIEIANILLKLIKNNKGKKIVKKLYGLIYKNPYKFLSKHQLKKNKTRAIADFISGMTDRYAINLYNSKK